MKRIVLFATLVMILIAAWSGANLTPRAGPLPESPPALQADQVFWHARIVQQYDAPMAATLIVQTIGAPGMPVEVIAEGINLQGITGTKPEYESACEFGGLRGSIYLVFVRDLHMGIYVDLRRGGFALVEFRSYTDFPPSAPAPRCVIRVLHSAPNPVRLTIANYEYDVNPHAPQIIGLDPGLHSYTISSIDYGSVTDEMDLKVGYWTWDISFWGDVPTPTPIPEAGPFVQGHYYYSTPTPTPEITPTVEEEPFPCAP
jgi:hypothetical protein